VRSGRTVRELHPESTVGAIGCHHWSTITKISVPLLISWPSQVSTMWRVRGQLRKLRVRPHVAEFMLPCAILHDISFTTVSLWAGSMRDAAHPPQSLPRDWTRPDIFAGACWEVVTPYWPAGGSFPTPLGLVHRRRPRG
jgi:hypothetical protein